VLSQPSGVPREQVERILEVIPHECLRDRVLFRLIFEAGLRIGEALGIYVEDLDLSPDDERLHIRGKRQRRRTVLLEDSGQVKLRREYLKLAWGALSCHEERTRRSAPLSIGARTLASVLSVRRCAVRAPSAAA
jgi:site-specific recombinase XerD